MITINQRQVSAVLNAMVEQIIRKGAPNKMVSMEQIEVQLDNNGVGIFIPLRHVLSDLTKRGYVRYFKLDSGKLVYGVQKSKQEELFGTQQQTASTYDHHTDIFDGSKPIDITDDDLPF